MLPLAVIVVLGLATYRLTRLCTSDSITLPAREAVFRFAYTDEFDAEAWLAKQPRTVREIPSHIPRGGLRTWIYALATCDQCLGVWWGAAIYTAWVMRFDVNTDVVAAVITVAALLGIQSVVAWVVDLVAATTARLDHDA